MKATRNILLGIGIMGLSAASFGWINGDAFMDHLITMICGVSLIFGYFTIHKTENSLI